MTRILLGQSYYLRFDPKLYAAMQPYPPLGTLYAASFLRTRGHDVSVFDAMLAGSETEWASALDYHQPRFAVLYEDNFNYLSKMCLLRMREAAYRMISMAKSAGCTVILCGADATDNAELYLGRGADYVIRGEGELTLAELMDAAPDGAAMNPAAIPGLVWKNDAGVIKRSAGRTNITQLDSLPFPAWNLVDVERYRELWTSRHGSFSMNMVTTRGCPYHCNWCAKPIWGQRYNSRSPANVVEELKWLQASYRPDHIWFADDIFGLKPGWVEEFGALLREKKQGIPFKCQMRADLVRHSTVEGLKASRCETVWLGAESGSQKILDSMEKGITVDQIRQSRRLLGAAGIKVALFLQFGYQGETRADIDQTMEMVRELKPDEIGISVSYPLPGTPFFERVRAQLGEKRNWNDSADLAMLYRGPFSARFYRTLYQAVHSEFRMLRAVERIRSREAGPALGRERKLRALASIPKHWVAWRAWRWRLHRLRENCHEAGPASEEP